jgi:hypothetical protein
MLIKFELNMPSVGSWNNKWTGEKDLYARIVKFTSKERKMLAEELLKIGGFIYNFGDGWVASVCLEKIDSKEAQKIRKCSKGFYGYDWMITSILKNKSIKVDES